MPYVIQGVGAALGAVGVALGAFGAHALRSRISLKLQTVFETGVRYQMYHALALFGVAWAAGRFAHRAVQWAGWLMTAGTLIFSGTLYLLAITGARWWGAVTPAGGAMLIAGWALLAWGVYSARQ
ncbi:MAG: DUF423 domain-containing protein [Gemmatimonadales bacterium]